MNKTLKVLLYVALVISMLLVLVGCGNKLVATREEEEEIDGKTVKVEEKMEIFFKKDKVNKIKATMTFNDKDVAKKYLDQYNSLKELAKSMGADEEELARMPELKQNGKSLSMELKGDDVKDIAGFDTEKSKEDIKKALEEEGYKVK